MTEYQLAALIEEGAAIKAAITENTKRLREIGVILADHAVFPDGKNTAHMAGSSHKATIQRKETINWDQDLLAQARAALRDTLKMLGADYEMMRRYLGNDWQQA